MSGSDTENEASKTPQTEKPQNESQQVIHNYYTQQDNSVFPKTVPLDESNYTIWAPLMRMRIGARGKIGYLTGVKDKPNMKHRLQTMRR